MVELTQDRLKEVLCYCKSTGIFTRAKTTTGGRVGTISGCKNHEGYLAVSIDKKSYKAHRLAFLYMNGVMPSMYVDHVNGIKDDNSWDNLRECTASQNRFNTGLTVKNKSGVKGVYFNKRHNKWHAAMTVNKKRIHVGFFDSLNDAKQAYIEASAFHHKEFARN